MEQLSVRLPKLPVMCGSNPWPLHLHLKLVFGLDLLLCGVIIYRCYKAIVFPSPLIYLPVVVLPLDSISFKAHQYLEQHAT